MTTEKKNSSSDPESKAGLSGKAETQAQRLAELCSSVNLSESYKAVYRFRDSLDEALVAIDTFVAEAKRVSDKLREEGFDVAADFFSTWADQKAAVTSPAFHKTAQTLIELVVTALVNGSPSYLRQLEASLFDRGRGRAEWGRLCSSYWGLLRNEPLPSSLWDLSEDDDPWLSVMLGDNVPWFANRLISSLTFIDPRAEALTPEQVIRAAQGSTTTDTGFAAKLAWTCKAFNYDWETELDEQPEDGKDPKKAQQDVQDRAQRAITKAMKEDAG